MQHKTDNSASVNPVTEAEFAQFSALLTSKLDVNVPDWLKGQQVVACAFGSNSMFKVCCDVLTEHRREVGGPAAAAPPPIRSVTLADVKEAISHCLNKTDAELHHYVDFRFSDGPAVVVQKLALLCAVLEHTGIQRIKCVPCIGSCGGLLGDARFWLSSRIREQSLV